jgi:tetratricopeptide (TPR) repeat protein
VAQAIHCPSCGVKIRIDRPRCPRCRTKLVPSVPSQNQRAQVLTQWAAVLVIVGLVAVPAVWIRTRQKPAVERRDATPSQTSSAAQAKTARARGTSDAINEHPFIEARGAGGLAYTAGDYASALEQFQAAVEKNPEDAESLSNLGQVLVRLDRVTEAIPYFERAVALIPQRWAYRFNLARALSLLGRWEESIAAYREAQRLFPSDYATTFNLGLALHKSGDDTAAVEEYNKAVALDPSDPSFRMALATSLERLHRSREAAAVYGEYLRLAPAAPDVDKVRARIEALTSQMPTAPTR